MSNTNQLEKDIAYCIDYLELNDTQIGFVLRACEQLGVSAEYFAEEFDLQTDNEDDLNRLWDENYLTINWGLN